MYKFIYYVPDYEHSGDLEQSVHQIKSECPKACNFNTYQERDYEAESDYKSEYGELDEPIYLGVVKFEAPKECIKQLKEIGCYERFR